MFKGWFSETYGKTFRKHLYDYTQNEKYRTESETHDLINNVKKDIHSNKDKCIKIAKEGGFYYEYKLNEKEIETINSSGCPSVTRYLRDLGLKLECNDDRINPRLYVLWSNYGSMTRRLRRD
jgi:hypothetical protein